MKVQRDGKLKPQGWSIGWGHHPEVNGFRWRVWGGTLYIPEEGFREWYFRIPLIQRVVVLTHLETSH